MTIDREDKRFILQTILDGVLKDAGTDFRVATLGGEGLEAGLWKAAGIPHRHGWLIESSPKKGKKLIQKSDYMLLEGQLEKFRRMFDSQEGVDIGLRLFHWDLCGTVEPSIADLASVLPLLERSSVSTLVVTVADARGNLALAKPKDAERRIEKLFRKNGAQIKRSLIELYGRSEDPRPTVTRELSTVGLIFEKLNKLEVVSMVRYFYLSMHIRMRTYVFHLKPRKETTTHTEFRRQQLSAWLGSDVHWIKDGKANGIPPFVTEADKRKVMNMDQVSPNEVSAIKTRLSPFMAMMNPDIKSDFERLIELATTPKIDIPKVASEIAVQVVEKLFGGLKNGTALSKGAASAKAVSAPAPAKNGNGHKSNGLNTRSQAAHKFSSLSLENKDALRVELLKAAKKSEKAYDKKATEIIQAHGLSRVPNRHKQIGTMFARCQGQHRPEFVARMASRAVDAKAREAMLKDLAPLYGVAVEVLEREAKKSGAKPATKVPEGATIQ